jgi:hypothetical protein
LVLTAGMFPIMASNIIESTIIIAASTSKVWQILTDFDQYHQWNPFTPKIELSKTIGSVVRLHVRMQPNSNKTFLQKETLQYWKEGEQINWGIEKAWYLQTVRIQKLTKLADGRTEYYTSDVFNGPLKGVVLWLYRAKIQRGFDAVAEALKVEAERS